MFFFFWIVLVHEPFRKFCNFKAFEAFALKIETSPYIHPGDLMGSWCGVFMQIIATVFC